MEDKNLQKVLQKYDTLNEGQTKGLLSLIAWYKSGFNKFGEQYKNKVLIDSFSGYGKSHLIRVFYEYLKMEKV